MELEKWNFQTKQFFPTLKFVHFRVNEKSATNLKFELTEAVNQDYFWLKINPINPSGAMGRIYDRSCANSHTWTTLCSDKCDDMNLYRVQIYMFIWKMLIETHLIEISAFLKAICLSHF